MSWKKNSKSCTGSCWLTSLEMFQLDTKNTDKNAAIWTYEDATTLIPLFIDMVLDYV